MNVSAFLRNKKLMQDYKITSMSENSNHQLFVSSFEHKSLPIFGVQFTLQTASFEWKSQLSIPHDPNSLLFNQMIGHGFSGMSRYNKHNYTVSD